MTEIARVTRHPVDRDIVLLHPPPDMFNEFGRFGPARYSQDHKAFLLHNEHIPALYRFARTISLHVVDERVKSSPGSRTQPVECSFCQQPGSMGRPPKSCPACGEPWVPTPPPVSEESKGRYECASCHHRQGGRFPFCASCGAKMTYHRPEPRQAVEPRRRLKDPEPLSASVERLARRNEVVLPTPSGPRQPRSHKGRPVETVDLLGSAAGDGPPPPKLAPPQPALDPSEPGSVTPGQLTRLHILFGEAGIADRGDKLLFCQSVTDREIESTRDLSKNAAGFVMDALQRIVNQERAERARRTGEVPSW